MMFQESALFPWLTAYQNIEIALKMGKIPKEHIKNSKQRIMQIIQLKISKK